MLSSQITGTAPALAEPAVAEEEKFYRKAIRAFFKNRVATIAFVILVLIVLSILLANWISPYSPLEGDIKNRLQPIGTPGYFLGTDEQGRDMLTRILYGGRLTLLSGFLPVIVAAIAGGALGIIAGYYGGTVNAIIMRTLDIFYAFPAVILSIAVSAALGQGSINIMIAISIVFIPPVARVLETAVKRIRNQEFIEAAKSSGASSLQIMRHHIVPNVFSELFVYSSSQISIGIVIAAGLSFLGLGVSPPTPEWGVMLNSIKQLIFVDPLLTVVPGGFLFLTSLCINLCADGIRDALQVK
ncbi:ABC transporter permease [Paenibacillus sp. S150]|uniref:ABC transporter permease n=1 Tax=Paenibacillus sp. S150 TaxID=2749826 RepID=UPI001C593C0F|nr:ABC transporter permease [Paenibacillus sp. S150]MBW4085207.1 ABC transporter permease [Paenibacillus sp. S150]